MDELDESIESAELRDSPRFVIRQNIQINNCATGQLQGTLINLSDSGFLLMSQIPVHSGHIYQFQFTSDDNAIHPSLLGAECIWTSALETAGAWAGFRIIDIAPNVANTLKQLQLANAK